MKNSKIYLAHIIDEITYIENNVMNVSKEIFMNNPTLCRASVRSLEVIGEAIKNVPDEFRNSQPTVAWKEFAGLRDILIHKYFGIDYDMVWDIIHEELPVLKDQIASIMNK